MKVKDRFGKVSLMKNYVFMSVFGDNPELCRQLVEVTCGIKVADIEISQTERMFDFLAEFAGGRLDLYVVDTDGNRYNLEVQAINRHDEPLRARKYQSLMDVTQLRKGTEARDFHESRVVFICGFDPFGHGLRRYDTGTACLQTGERVEDGRSATYLYTKGSGDEVGERLVRLLDLFAGEADDGDDDPLVSDILKEMEKCVDDPEWMEGFMTFEEEKRREIEAAVEAAVEEAVKVTEKETREKTREKTREQVTKQYAQLAQALRAAGREGELVDAMTDAGVCDALLREFGIAELA